jgi:CBS domain-containing protein
MKVKRAQGSVQAPAPRPSSKRPDSGTGRRGNAERAATSPPSESFNRGQASERPREQAVPSSPRLCREVMSKHPTCCLPSDPVDVIAQLMVTEDVGSLPVVRDLQATELIGIVTDRDLTVRVVAEGRDPKGVVVGEVMTLEPMACHVEDELQRVLDIMAEHQVRRVPVVDNSGSLVGIIAQADIATRVAAPAKTARVVEEISQSPIRSEQLTDAQ